MPKDKLLVTTALEETWGNRGEYLIFLGEWCRDYSRKESWNNRLHEVLPYHWKDRSKFKKDHDYLERLNEKLLDALTLKLNCIHNIDKPKMYWRIIIGPWLLTYLSILWDRWESVSYALKKSSYQEIISLEYSIQEQNKLIPFDYIEFVEFMNMHSWNGQIYSKILDFQGAENHIHKYISISTNRSSFKYSWKHRLKSFFDYWLGKIPIKEKVLFVNSYFDFWNIIRLSINLRQVPRLHSEFESIRQCLYSEVSNDKLLVERKSVLPIQTDNNFEKFVGQNILNQLPKLTLEGFSGIYERVKSISTDAKVIFTANAHMNNYIFQIWAAEQSCFGKKLITSSHGGAMTSQYIMFGHEEKISHKKIVWTTPHCENHVQLPANKIIGMKYKESKPGDKLLIVDLEFPIYSYRCQSGPGSSLLLENIIHNIKFYKLLTSHISKVFKVTPYNQGWSKINRYTNILSDNDEVSSAPILQEILRSKVVVCTYPQTTFLEAMHSGVPTILLYMEKYWELEDAFEGLIQMMKEAKIIFSDAEEAANHINSVWDNPKVWWGSPQVVAAREKFFDMCGRTNPNWLDEWSSFFNKELEEIADE